MSDKIYISHRLFHLIVFLFIKINLIDLMRREKTNFLSAPIKLGRNSTEIISFYLCKKEKKYSNLEKNGRRRFNWYFNGLCKKKKSLKSLLIAVVCQDKGINGSHRRNLFFFFFFASCHLRLLLYPLPSVFMAINTQPTRQTPSVIIYSN